MSSNSYTFAFPIVCVAKFLFRMPTSLTLFLSLSLFCSSETDTDTFPQKYSYEVEMRIDIDELFLLRQGGSAANAVDYINVLVSAANILFEKEIDTHLRVSQIVLTGR